MFHIATIFLLTFTFTYVFLYIFDIFVLFIICFQEIVTKSVFQSVDFNTTFTYYYMFNTSQVDWCILFVYQYLSNFSAILMVNCLTVVELNIYMTIF